ncbi:50S ribosomal protein L23 [Xylocopilactobacillus apicola]|uniref:Large ribosomal subunit protein uL23 n=1 Tax=Xylocopilactobacillus apicola TaxID=2932184 RepID=A0AAU9DF43_9LACO|nr:50S ribosomal protein L23 [Xylocopilactobacillus apicola]BDR59537.1 50S ribosomal protein L23 [Xylocopilactobacillus apicola]
MSDSVHDVIKTPVITEKSMDLMGQHKYTFYVAPGANKIQIRHAIEEIFDVKVKEVNLMNIRKKFRRYGRYSGYKAGKRKAIITLTADSKEIPVMVKDQSTDDKKDDNK